MFEERKISPELRKQYREKGYWKDETLLDCWDRTEKYLSAIVSVIGAIL